METSTLSGQLDPSQPTPERTSSLWPKLLTIVLVAGVIAILIAILPSGYSRDLSVIGKGSNVVVQVHDHNRVSSIELMEAVSTIRDEYEGHITFLVADVYTPEGKQFKTTYGIDTAALVFFAPNGEQLAVLYGQQDAEELRKALQQAFRLDQ